MTATVEVQPPTGLQPSDRVRALVALLDRSTTPCRVEGVAGLALPSSGSSRPLAVSQVDLDGGATPVAIPAGGSAYAGLEWTSAPGCPRVDGFALRPSAARPGEVAALVDSPAAASGAAVLRLCGGAVDLTPWQPSAMGAVGFPDSFGSGGPACAPEALLARLVLGPPTATGAMSGELVLAARGGACVVGGFPGLHFVDRTGDAVETSVADGEASSPRVELTPGVVGVAALTVTPALLGPVEGTRADCATGLAVSVGGSMLAGRLEVPGRAVCPGSFLTVAALRPLAASTR